MRIEPEGAAPPNQEHLFTPPAGQPWGLCVICRLGEAAHIAAPRPWDREPGDAR